MFIDPKMKTHPCSFIQFCQLCTTKNYSCLKHLVLIVGDFDHQNDVHSLRGLRSLTQTIGYLRKLSQSGDSLYRDLSQWNVNLYDLFGVSLQPLGLLLQDPDLIQFDQMTRRFCTLMSGHLRVHRARTVVVFCNSTNSYSSPNIILVTYFNLTKLI